MIIDNEIITASRKYHKKFRLIGQNHSIGDHDRSAKSLCLAWQNEVNNGIDIFSEVCSSSKANEMIDLIDSGERIAYELKMSGKNPHHEYYKDLCKVINYNILNPDSPVKTFVFINEKSGVNEMIVRLSPEFIKEVSIKHLIEIKFGVLNP